MFAFKYDMVHYVINMLTIPLQTLLISAIMGIACCLPRFVNGIQRYSRVLLLVGTGGLVSLLVYDLIPDVWEIGGPRSVLIIALAWGVYSLAHASHHDHSSHDHSQTEHQDHGGGGGDLGLLKQRPTKFLMASMIIHCSTSGIFLALAQELSSKVAFTVFLALIGHKGYEALSVSLVLNQRLKKGRAFALYALAYAISFPAGVIFALMGTRFFGPQLGHSVMRSFAMVAASVAIGSLMGCMIHDFIIPSYHQIRARRIELGWVALGVVLTLVFTGAA